MMRRTMVLTLRQVHVWKPRQVNVLQPNFDISGASIEAPALLRQFN
ncbi:hypothetical protein [Rhizobium leguminosarum]|nr:hypothetical protein [Rhizobium leguminosarum]